MNNSSSTYLQRCPTCDMVVDTELAKRFLPFCSHRCRMVDLGRWLNEEHTLPVNATEEQSEETMTESSSVKLPPGWHDA